MTWSHLRQQLSSLAAWGRRRRPFLGEPALDRIDSEQDQVLSGLQAFHGLPLDDAPARAAPRRNARLVLVPASASSPRHSKGIAS